MSPKKTVFIFLISLAFTDVATWTIDLPEARKYFFEKAEDDKKSDELKKDFNPERLFFDNIVPDSPHNKEELEHNHENVHETGHDEGNDVNGDKYAQDYEYMSYMEKKVHNIVRNGSVYLEGLRRALEDYADLLQNCSRLNFTQPRSPNGPWLPENERPMPSADNLPSLPNFDTNNPSAVPNFGPGNFTQIPNGTFFRQLNQTLDTETCERATRYSEHVRRIAALALWATRELQDRAYANKYDKQSQDEEEEEAELLLRLAFFLDRLAYLTGYEPEAKDFTTTTTTPRPTPPAVPMTVMGDVSDEAKTSMMNCLNTDSSDPDKCRFPQSSPEFLRRNISDSSQSVQPPTYTPRDPSLREMFRNPSSPLFRRRQKRHLQGSSQGVQSASYIPQDPSFRNPTPPGPRRRSKRHLQDNNEFVTAEEREDFVDDRDKRGILKTGLLAKKIAHKVAEELHEDRSFEHHQHPIFPRGKIIMERLAAVKHGARKLVEKIVELRHEHRRLERSAVVKRDALTNRKKRSTGNDPALELMKYYVKHQVWVKSNPTQTGKMGDYDVENHLNTVKLTDEHQVPTVKIQKRSVDKKYGHLRAPEGPFMEKPRFAVNYVHDENEAQKLHEYLMKVRHSSPGTAKDYVRKLLKKHKIQKRSVEYGNKFLPSRSQNPRQDISYYVKNKEGTEDSPNVSQAAAVRGSLEKIFQNPNIEVVRRYGSNFNAVQFPLAYGLANSFFVDI